MFQLDPFFLVLEVAIHKGSSEYLFWTISQNSLENNYDGFFFSVASLSLTGRTWAIVSQQFLKGS